MLASASGCSGKERPHLRLGLDVRFLAGEAEPLGIIEVAAGADREQDVVRFRVFPLEVVRIVGGDDTEAELAPESEHALGDRPFLGDAVLLDLQPEAVGTERRANHSALCRASSYLPWRR